jgi:Ser/Thr protein kinase RdoA (MazF antagonist)
MESVARHRVDNEVLHTAVEPLLSEHFGKRCRIRRLRRRLSIYSSSYTIENLEIDLDRGRRLRLVMKDLSPASLLPAARQVRPYFLHAPLREIETYRKLLRSQDLGTPVYYGSVASPELERYWLFLERVQGPLLWQVGCMDTWRQAAQWLASLHSEFGAAIGPQNHPRLAHLLRYDERFLRLWPTRAEEFVRHRRIADCSDALRRFGRLADRYDGLVKRLLDLPMTVVHGEFYPSNVILREADGRRPICAIDWEMASIAPGLVDLAALTAGDWTEEQKRTLVAAYREALDAKTGQRPSMLELIEGVRCCQLHLCVQLLGWASDWSPPEQHARNWLREALGLAQTLGLLAT